MVHGMILSSMKHNFDDPSNNLAQIMIILSWLVFSRRLDSQPTVIIVLF
jgi:hypothetical protein